MAEWKELDGNKLRVYLQHTDSRMSMIILEESLANKKKVWVADEIYNLLIDGVKFRKLKEGKKIEKELSQEGSNNPYPKDLTA